MNGIKIQPNPPQAGGTAVVTVPHEGPWYIYISDVQTGQLTELGPLRSGGDQTLEIAIPATAEGDRLTITDEAEPLPTDADFPIVSNR
jgi:hypothetical protein